MSTSTASPATLTTWNLDPAHSAAEFKIKHMMISHVKGKFTGLSGTLNLHETDHSFSSVEASVDVASIHTGDPQRDGHLKTAEFFDVEKFPKMSFKSTRVERNSNGGYAVTGELTIHGATKTETFDVEDINGPAKDPWGNTRIGLSATTKINRKDFGLHWNAALEAGGFMVGDEATISLDVEFIKA
jgi:polyisoprenoid-binding protein YceI